ncbi:MAG: hypothetical protein F6K26_15125 [Moorea sp. SIO2I5]|nr:hypothetical protein [Moorena sp. SIO2I5]
MVILLPRWLFYYQDAYAIKMPVPAKDYHQIVRPWVLVGIAYLIDRRSMPDLSKAMPTLQVSLSTPPDSRFPIPDSRFPIPDSRFPTPDSRFPYLKRKTPIAGVSLSESQHLSKKSHQGKHRANTACQVSEKTPK